MPATSATRTASGTPRTEQHVVVVGAGIGGLASAIDLAASGIKVTLLERSRTPGGKIRQLEVGGQRIDSGPTVFTMRWVFEKLFDSCGENLADWISLTAAEVLARHSWSDGSRLDLYSDLEQSVEAIGEFAGAREASAYRKFAAESRAIFETLDESFMQSEKPGPLELTFSLGLAGLPRLVATKPYRTLWSELGRTFRDARLQQLFGRYATYCGSSPFKSPATLMLIAHAERSGVWIVDGGMQQLATAMAGLAEKLGVKIYYESEVTGLVTQRGQVHGVELSDGEVLAVDAVVFNGDVAALTRGLLGEGARSSMPARSAETRSLSAITWSMLARTDGFSLDHHNVFFGSDYRGEFDSIFRQRRVTAEPTVYICAQDRGVSNAVNGPERLLMLVNAPPCRLSSDELEAIERRSLQHLGRHGLMVMGDAAARVRSTPDDYAKRFPGSDGAIYGWPTHGMMGSFKRAGSRSSIPGLYLAGGTVHPGPGVPMVALSGRLAAASIRSDFAAL